MFGASWGELSFVAILLVIVLLAQIAPRIGEAIGARYEPGSPGEHGERGERGKRGDAGREAPRA